MAGGWGEPETDHGDHIPGGEHDLGGGHKMVLNPEAFKALLHSPEVIAAITARTNAIRDDANSLVAMDPRTVARVGKGEPAYTSKIHAEDDDKRPHGRVYPNNMLGALDEAQNSTLEKAMQAHPSDPIPGEKK
ncbi:hypothetical protein [Mycobacterium paragordonae]|uniref:hypothetical protein n=1 Tax=Mycobacterium paragordonae TaxID=1389713 RepID=UPI0012E28C68|nr:hypothetical protein [Mycobacterium paragordonae]